MASKVARGLLSKKPGQLQRAVILLVFRPTESSHKMRVSIAPGFAHRLRPADHCHRFEARQTLETAIVREQELAAPERAIVAETQPVERDAEHRRRIQRHVIVGEATRDMSVMMLHFDERQRVARGPFFAEFARQVFGMSVGGECLRFVLEQAPV